MVKDTNYINEVKQYALSLKNMKLTDGDKADKITDYILNLKGKDKKGIEFDVKDNTKKFLLVSIKPYLIENKIFKNNDYVDKVNSRELYDRIMKQTTKNRIEKGSVDVDMDTIEKLLKLKCNKKLNFDTEEYEVELYSLYIYLLFTSGLRTNEITENDFSIVDKNTIKPKRISKSFNKEFDGDAIVNLLIPSTEWIALFNNLQNRIKDKKMYQSSLSSGITRKLKTIQTGLTGHTLRKLYLAYHLQIKKTDTDKLPSLTTQKLLNHNNEITSVYYNGAVKITGELKDVIDNTDYSKYTIAKLKDVLKSKNIPFKSNTKKADLIKLLTC
jgi:integrase